LNLRDHEKWFSPVTAGTWAASCVLFVTLLPSTCISVCCTNFGVVAGGFCGYFNEDGLPYPCPVIVSHPDSTVAEGDYNSDGCTDTLYCLDDSYGLGGAFPSNLPPASVGGGLATNDSFTDYNPNVTDVCRVAAAVVHISSNAQGQISAAVLPLAGAMVNANKLMADATVGSYATAGWGTTNFLKSNQGAYELGLQHVTNSGIFGQTGFNSVVTNAASVSNVVATGFGTTSNAVPSTPAGVNPEVFKLPVILAGTNSEGEEVSAEVTVTDFVFTAGADYSNERRFIKWVRALAMVGIDVGFFFWTIGRSRAVAERMWDGARQAGNSGSSFAGIQPGVWMSAANAVFILVALGVYITTAYGHLPTTRSSRPNRLQSTAPEQTPAHGIRPRHDPNQRDQRKTARAIPIRTRPSYRALPPKERQARV